MSRFPQTPQSPSTQSSPESTGPSSSTTKMSTNSFTSTLPTPTHSVNGSAPMSDSINDVTMSDVVSPNKRKRSVDEGDREKSHKKIHIETDSGPSLSDLHADVGELYLLGAAPYRSTKIDLSKEIFHDFGLSDLAAKVARVLPNGEKNALRKTYKGHIKRLAVEGHFDAIKNTPNEDGSISHLLRVNPQDWHVYEVQGRNIESGLSAELEGLLKDAMSLAPGPIPKKAWDASVLGDLAPDKVAATKKVAPVVVGTNRPAVSTIASGIGKVPGTKAQGAAAQEATRSRRNVKKRSYGDSSFEGYDGYDDETGHDTGYSTAEGDGMAAKRRKKNVNSTIAGMAANIPQAASRKQSYGPGMIA